MINRMNIINALYCWLQEEVLESDGLFLSGAWFGCNKASAPLDSVLHIGRGMKNGQNLAWWWLISTIQ